MLITCLICILLCHSKNTNPHQSDICMHKINYYLRYLIQFLDGRCNDLWLFPFPMKTLSDQFNGMKMKLASALNIHKSRRLCCIKREDLVID